MIDIFNDTLQIKNSIAPSKYIFGEFSDKDEIFLIEEIIEKIENKTNVSTNISLFDSSLNLVKKKENFLDNHAFIIATKNNAQTGQGIIFKFLFIFIYFYIFLFIFIYFYLFLFYFYFIFILFLFYFYLFLYFIILIYFYIL